MFWPTDKINGELSGTNEGSLDSLDFEGLLVPSADWVGPEWPLFGWLWNVDGKLACLRFRPRSRYGDQNHGLAFGFAWCPTSVSRQF